MYVQLHCSVDSNFQKESKLALAKALGIHLPPIICYILLVQIMQQKLVIKIKFRCKKCRSKAMTIAAMTSGVQSVKVEGDEKDRVVVIGDGVDAVGMILLLRKKVGHATLELVSQLQDQD